MPRSTRFFSPSLNAPSPSTMTGVVACLWLNQRDCWHASHVPDCWHASLILNQRQGTLPPDILTKACQQWGVACLWLLCLTADYLLWCWIRDKTHCRLTCFTSCWHAFSVSLILHHWMRRAFYCWRHASTAEGMPAVRYTIQCALLLACLTTYCWHALLHTADMPYC